MIPPDIIYKETSSDMAVTEGNTVTLICKTTGYPTPKTTWRREDGGAIILKTAGRDKIKG
uniref:Ig-like domain-containing protein n=1 Tax=Strigamia maritima TaxID=126957 RepID=T1JP54_STRMM